MIFIYYRRQDDIRYNATDKMRICYGLRTVRFSKTNISGMVGIGTTTMAINAEIYDGSG